MSRMETGLRYRLKRAARQMAAQHRHLSPIFETLGSILDERNAEKAHAGFRKLREALGAHFALEDDVVFPALHGLLPACAVDLEALSREHEQFLEEMRRMADVLSRDLDGFARDFNRLSVALQAHEEREHRIVRLVTDGAGSGD